MQKTSLKISIVFLSLSLLSACGFQLRGYSSSDAPPAFSSLKLDCPSTQAWQLCQTLRQQFALSAITIDEDARYLLTVSPIQQETRTLSLQKNATASEYGLSSTVNYQLIDQQSDSIVSDHDIVVRNSYRHQSSALLAKERERNELQTELSQQIAMEVFRQIDVLNKQILNPELKQD